MTRPQTLRIVLQILNSATDRQGVRVLLRRGRGAAVPYQTQGPANAPAPGTQFTITMTPPVPPGCAFCIYINDQLAFPGSRIGGVKLVGYGATANNATATLEATTDNPSVTIYFAIMCPPNPRDPTYVPHEIGGGWNPPRQDFDPDEGGQLPRRPEEPFVPTPPNRKHHRKH